MPLEYSYIGRNNEALGESDKAELRLSGVRWSWTPTASPKVGPPYLPGSYELQ